MVDKTMWMVRAGEGGSAVQDFLAKGIVAIGWTDGSSDWTKYANRAAIQAKISAQSRENTDI
jgi:predicted Mrr-cat superfamily restriction endonuclease